MAHHHATTDDDGLCHFAWWTDARRTRHECAEPDAHEGGHRCPCGATTGRHRASS